LFPDVRNTTWIITKLFPSLVFTVLVSAAPRVFPAQPLPASDPRAAALKDLNTPLTFPRIESKAERQARAKDLRENIRRGCGQWPLPPKTPLNAHVFGKIERDGTASRRRISSSLLA
jgi:hypothetical protein